ncbi:hypothetical protein U1701_04260 [Sphingomonas sp. PB2P19]|uniref:hypothetical protein n=1 Tax=Sphingomonas rhamnosi TaxID=3096156 RepID=UPI002FCAF5F7
MAVQDDSRENVMVAMFNLKQAPDRARHDPDAFLDHQGHRFLFELKSTTNNSISTVRDFGPDHIKKWLEMHWIVGFFKSGVQVPTYCYYLTPLDMKKWTDEIWEYVKVDFAFADIAAKRITIDDLYDLFGQKNSYSVNEAKSINKKQYTASEYIEKCDLSGGISPSAFNRTRCPFVSDDWFAENIGFKDVYAVEDILKLVNYQSNLEIIAEQVSGRHVDGDQIANILPPSIIDREGVNITEGISAKKASSLIKSIATKKGLQTLVDIRASYSPSAMLEIIRDRCRYLINRGSTLNNPHINEEFFARFDQIDDEHAQRLREKLSAYLLANPPKELLGDGNTDSVPS